MFGALGVAALIAATSIFVAAEFSLVSVDRSRVQQGAKAGSRYAQATLAVQERLSYHLSAIQLGITVTSVTLGYVAEPTIAPWLQPLLEKISIVRPQDIEAVSVTLALILATVISMVVGELVPKNFAIASPYRTAVALGFVIRGYGIAFKPIITALNGAANWAVRRFGMEPREELASIRTLEELEMVVRSAGAEGVLEDESVQRLSRTFRFASRNAADLIVPRRDVTTVSASASITDLIALSATSGHSRFPVIDDDLDNALGVVHIKDVYDIATADRDSTNVRSLMHDIPALPETVNLDRALPVFQSGGHLALVIDEHGGVTGIITLDDILADLVGDIYDEHDEGHISRTNISLQKNGFAVLPGDTHVDDVNESIGLTTPEGPYDTLAGFVLQLAGRIPEEGETFEYEQWSFEVAKRDGLRISSVRVFSKDATT